MAGSYNKVKYRKLPRDDLDSFIDAQFEERKSKVPWKALALATFLATVGFLLLVFGILIIGGYTDVKYADRMWPFFILGIIMFLPGAYHMRIAYYAYMGRKGYSFDEIPEFE